MELLIAILERLDAAERHLRIRWRILRTVLSVYEYSPILILKRRREASLILKMLLVLNRSKLEK